MTLHTPTPHRPRRRYCARGGFTLVEMIIIIAMTALALVTLGMLLAYFYKTNAYTIEEATAVNQARRGVEMSMRDLREASYGNDGSYPIASVATSSITFFANVDADAVIERVTYVRLDKTLYRVIAKPTGNPPSYATPLISTSTVSTSVVNATSTPLFRYYDTTSVELTYPINISRIVSVQTEVVIDVNTQRAPIAFTLMGGAELRNLNDQL